MTVLEQEETAEKDAANVVDEPKRNRRDSFFGFLIAIVILSMFVGIIMGASSLAKHNEYEDILKSAGSDVEQWSIANPVLAASELYSGKMTYSSLLFALSHENKVYNNLPESVSNSSVIYHPEGICIGALNGEGYSFYSFAQNSITDTYWCP